MTIAERNGDMSALLTFYLNGTLNDEESRDVEAALAKSAKLRHEAEVLSRIRREIRAEEAPQSPGEFGLARLMRDVDALERAAPTPAAANSNRVPLWQRAGALAAAMVTGAAVTVMLMGRPDPVAIQASGGDGLDYSGPTLTVAFREDATVQEISEALSAHDLVIVDGPSAIGLYRVGAPYADGIPVDLAAALRARENVFEHVDDPQ